MTTVAAGILTGMANNGKLRRARKMAESVRADVLGWWAITDESGRWLAVDGKVTCYRDRKVAETARAMLWLAGGKSDKFEIRRFKK